MSATSKETIQSMFIKDEYHSCKSSALLDLHAEEDAWRQTELQAIEEGWWQTPASGQQLHDDMQF